MIVGRIKRKVKVMEYSVYSDLDMEQHKKTFINYLEVVIDENGKIMYAVPSHQEKLIKLACQKTESYERGIECHVSAGILF